MEALCKVVTGERNDFIFHSDNWVKRIAGSSAKVLCPHSYPRDLLSNQESLQGEDEADASPGNILGLSCRGAGLEAGQPYSGLLVPWSPQSPVLNAQAHPQGA